VDCANSYIALSQRLGPNLNVFVTFLNDLFPVISENLRPTIGTLVHNPAPCGREQGNILTMSQKGA
jgi:hypothetical protein